MKAKLLGLLTAAAVVAGAPAQAQELRLGYLPSLAGPFATLSRTNEIAMQIAIDEINAAGGVNGKKISAIAFDTAGKPDQAVVGLRKPDPRIYELVLSKLGVEAPEAVYLDDLGINLKPARAMGMTTIKVGDPEVALAELAGILGFEVT